MLKIFWLRPSVYLLCYFFVPYHLYHICTGTKEQCWGNICHPGLAANTSELLMLLSRQMHFPGPFTLVPTPTISCFWTNCLQTSQTCLNILICNTWPPFLLCIKNRRQMKTSTCSQCCWSLLSASTQVVPSSGLLCTVCLQHLHKCLHLYTRFHHFLYYQYFPL